MPDDAKPTAASTDGRSAPALTWAVVRETLAECRDDRVSRLAAAMAFYAVFATAPLLVIGIRVAAVFFGRQRSADEADHRLRQLLGGPPADAVRAMLDQAAKAHAAGAGASLVGGGFLLYAAFTLFAELQDAMNTIWEVQAAPGRSWRRRALDRLGPFLMVAATGVVVLVSVAAGPALAFVNPAFGGPAWVHAGLRLTASTGLFLAVFAAVFKVLPDVVITWGDVAVGAAATAVLFTAGELLLRWYLGRPGVMTVYGTAGAVGVLLLWVYYSAVVLFVGAEFTQVYARRVGRGLDPVRGAVRLVKPVPEHPR